MIPSFISLLFYVLFISQKYQCKSKIQKEPLLALEKTLCLRHTHKSNISHEPFDYLGHRTRTDMQCSLVFLFFFSRIEEGVHPFNSSSGRAEDCGWLPRIEETALCQSSFWQKPGNSWMLGHPFTWWVLGSFCGWVILYVGPGTWPAVGRTVSNSKPVSMSF